MILSSENFLFIVYHPSDIFCLMKLYAEVCRLKVYKTN